jgi:hypothetical protein
MFTIEEKASSLAYTRGISHLTDGIADIAALGETRAHDFRTQFFETLNETIAIWDLATLWFAGLSGTIGGDRAAALAAARSSYDSVIAKMPGLIAVASTVPEMAKIAASFVSAKDALATFNWTLAYTDPRHAVNPALPFHADLTTVGPHGDWTTATAVMMHTADGIAKAFRTFVEVYRTVPVYTPLANHAFQEQVSRFARIMDLTARIWSMHIEVEYDADRLVIDRDMAASPTTRGRSFLRTLRQTELIFNNGTSKGPNFAGRGFETGIVEELRGLYFQEFIVPLGRVNGEDWSYALVIGDGTGGLFRFHSELTDFWQTLDSWAQAAYGFYHPVPDRTKWEVEHSGNVDPQDVRMIPEGFFNDEEAILTLAKADVAAAGAKLSDALASLRAKEGQEI